MQNIIQIITKLGKQGRCVLNSKFQGASIHSSFRNMLTCVCNTVEQCPAEAADYYRMIVWEGLRGTWDQILCTSHVGNPPVCERATRSTSVPPSTVITTSPSTTTSDVTTPSTTTTSDVTTPSTTTTSDFGTPSTTTSGAPKGGLGGKQPF